VDFEVVDEVVFERAGKGGMRRVRENGEERGGGG
jgi:hypothetical protein